MIGRLRGVLVAFEGSIAIVEVSGVGYEVFLPESLIHQLASGQEVQLLTRQIFREDGVSLYGFLTAFQRRLFDLLLTVKACGPKASLALIGQLGEDAVASAILAQDAKVLSRATGVGAKLAERITLELRDKIQEEAFLRKVDNVVGKKREAPVSELVDALQSLGYRKAEIDSVSEEAIQSSADVQEQLRAALRLLKK